MPKFFTFLLSLVLICLITPINSKASFNFTITELIPEVINSVDEEVEVKLKIEDLPSDSYFRAAFTQSDSKPAYFGKLLNDRNQWVDIEALSSKNCSNYFKVEKGIEEVTLTIKMGENVDSGNYFVRAHRFTSTCGSNSGSDNFKELTYGFIPTNTPTSQPVDTPTDTPKPTNTPKPTSISTPTSIPKNTPTEEPAKKDYDNIYISEVMPDPDEGSEWIELYNDNTFEVDLVDWFIDDEEGGSSPRKFTALIKPESYYVISISSNIFNNSGDDVRLLNHNQQEKDFQTYQSSKKGISWSRVHGSWCQTFPTKGEPNEDCLSEDKPTPTVKSMSNPTATPTVTEKITPTPTGDLTPSPTEILTPTPKTTSEPILVSTLQKNQQGEVLGEETEEDENNQNKKDKLIAGGFVVTGGLFIAGAGIAPQIQNLFAKIVSSEES